ncbi:DUF3747 domain-containing protein [Acaryochloris sp. IP29b_bin.137]|uniref:DUF3747 domain-containing protein n=1 Tax=Acaryochloris sp. IP29b_bin.137 TaxID=2969217 RepID=UPI00261750F1|nr:DUF3747 domain-containing protein [Acaryochloris sp. IP29b_bin.137]
MYHLSLHRLSALAGYVIPLAISLPVTAVAAPIANHQPPSGHHLPQNQERSQTLLAATFGQTAVSQEKFVAVAVPRDGGYYNLLILEQISGRKQCWKEHGASPTEIEPLLLNFDFTGICGRSTDSNGYSIRQAGKDLGLNYRLTLQRQGDELFLLGMPNSRRLGQPMEIGRTQGIGAGLLKVHLNPGWQFAKRTYKGKTLGHIYLNTNQSQPQLARRRLPPPRPFDRQAPIAASPARAVEIPVPLPSSSESPSSFRYRVVVEPQDSRQKARIKALVPDAFRSSYQGRSVMQVGLFHSQAKVKEMVKRLKQNDLRPEVIENDRSQVSAVSPSSIASRSVDIPVPSADRGRRFQSAVRQPNTLYRIVVRPRNSKQKSKIKALVPDAFRSSYQGRSVMQVGLFDNRSKADRMIKLMKRNGLKPEVIKDTRRRLSLRTVPARVGVLPVPGSRIPIGRADRGSDIYNLRAGLPPAPPSSSIALGPRYRVVVSTSSSRQRAKIKGLVPGAFRSSYRGRSVLQVGSFSSVSEARDRMQLIQRHGMNPILEKTQ